MGARLFFYLKICEIFVIYEICGRLIIPLWGQDSGVAPSLPL